MVQILQKLLLLTEHSRNCCQWIVVYNYGLTKIRDRFEADFNWRQAVKSFLERSQRVL